VQRELRHPRGQIGDAIEAGEHHHQQRVERHERHQRPDQPVEPRGHALEHHGDVDHHQDHVAHRCDDEQRDDGHRRQQRNPLRRRIELEPRQRETRGADGNGAQEPAGHPRQVVQFANAAGVNDRVDLPAAHDAADQEAQHRHGDRAKRERLRRGGEVRIPEELVDAGVDRQEVGDRHAEMRPAGKQQVEEPEPHRTGHQRGQCGCPVRADRAGDQPDQKECETDRAQPVTVKPDDRPSRARPDRPSGRFGAASRMRRRLCACLLRLLVGQIVLRASRQG
jgi:hypothetical protein